MKRVYITLLIVLLSLMAIAQDNYLWHYQGTHGSGNGPTKGMAMDGDGNIYLVGFHNEDLILGPTTIPVNGTIGLYIVKMNPQGNVVWGKSEAVTGAINVWEAEFGEDGKVYFTGLFQNTLTLGSQMHTSNGNYDAFVACYDTSGTHVWSRTFGHNVSEDYGYGIDANANGEVYTCGLYKNELTVDGYTIVGPPNSPGNGCYLIKFSNTGQAQWIKNFNPGLTNNMYCFDVTINGDTGCTVVGGFEGTLIIDGDTLTTNLINDYHGFIAKIDSSGNALATREITSSLFSQVFKVEQAMDGNIYVAGSYNKDFCIDTSCVVSAATIGGIFTIKYNNQLDTVWKDVIESPYFGSGKDPLDIKTDSLSKVHITTNIGNDSYYSNGDTLFGANNIVISYDSNGQINKAFVIDTVQNDYHRIEALEVIESSGVYYLAGLFWNSLNIDDTIYVSTGTEKMFVTKLDTATKDSVGVIISVGDIMNTPGVVVMPNPVRDVLTLKTDMDVKRITIYDVTGRLINTYNYKSRYLNVAVLDKGVYLLLIEGDTTRVLHKFVKE